MCKNICTALSVLAIVLASVSFAGATVVNVSITRADMGYPLYTGQGAYSDPGNNYWNGVSASPNPPTGDAGGWTTGIPTTATLLTSTGASTTVTFACGPEAAGGWGVVTPLALLGQGLICQSGASPRTDPDWFTIAGLTPGGAYSLYLYAVGDSSQGGGTHGSIFSFNNFTTTYTSTGTATSGFVLGGDYVVVSGLTASPSGQINGQWEDTGSGAWAAPFNGFQLISTTVPEPGTLALLAAGLAGLLCYAWRRHR